MKSTRTFSRSLTGLALLLLMVGSLFISPARRHAHQNGDTSHSHTETSAHRHAHFHHAHLSHDHSHSGHSHPHPHVHYHHPIGEQSAAGSEERVVDSHRHIHISILWFELTLPDFMGSGDPAADNPELVDFGHVFTLG